jgi:hypothetical protein
MQTASAETTKDRKEETERPAAASAYTANASAEKTYVLFEGTILETVLINPVAGELLFRQPHAVYETAMTYIPCSGNSLASDLFTSIP